MNKSLKILVSIIIFLAIAIFSYWYHYYDFAKGVQHDALNRERTINETIEKSKPKKSLEDTLFYYTEDEDGNPKKYNRFSITKAEEKIVDSLIQLSVNDFNLNWEDKIILKEYEQRTLGGFIDDNKNKIVKIYYACKYHKPTQGVLDGGKCYFRMEVNLTKRTYTDVIINSMG